MPRALTVCLLLVVASTTAAAQDPPAASPTTRLIPYTAVLPGTGPDAAAGSRTITFALYDEAQGGTLLWSETQAVRVDARGRYSTHLGAITALPIEIFRTEQARWLEVTVDGRALPRTMLVAVPYALRATDAETLGGKPLSEFVLTDGDGRRVRADGTAIDGPVVDGTGVPNQLAKWSSATTLSSSIMTESFDNRVGVLAPDPTGGGVVDSRFTIRHLDNNTAIGVLNTSNQRRFALNISASGWVMYDGGGNTWNAGLRQEGGEVGIGAFPQAKLEVHQQGSGEAGFFIVNTSTGLSALVGHHTGIGPGVRGHSDEGFGIRGTSGAGNAGEFVGNVTVTGTLTKGGGAFRIDHPLDPEHKYLSHSFVESPDMMNVYNGNVVLDAKGEAWVTLPDWFDALNRDFRYQLTPIGAPGPNLHVAAKIAENRFRIAGGAPGAEVSWQVTGIRQDVWANANRIPVEQDKPETERGRYLHPAAFGLPISRAIPSAQIDADIRERRRQH